MFLIVGLGNPTKQYEKTRHNIGFDVMDALADKYNISISENKHKALCGKGVIEGMKVVLAKPQTYMNLSGESVATRESRCRAVCRRPSYRSSSRKPLLSRAGRRSQASDLRRASTY